MGLKPGYALQMSHAKPTTRVLPNLCIVFTLKHRAPPSCPAQHLPRELGRAQCPKREEGEDTPALPWTSPAPPVPHPLGKLQRQQCPSVLPAGPGVSLDRHNEQQ